MNTHVKARRTLEAFIELARQVHGPKYVYSEAIYVNSPTPLRIICPDHGEFMQSPSNHLAGKGCRKCASKVAGDRYRKSSDGFVVDAKKVHGDRYDYSATLYKTARLKLTIRCTSHGPFEQVPHVHLRGAGCPECGNEASGERQRMTTTEFVSLSREKYGDKFDYSESQYNDAWTPVAIGCPNHGAFLQAPAAHLHNTTYGCPRCAKDDASNRGRGLRGPRPQDRLGTVTFIERATKVHSGKYDYSQVEYATSKDKVCIICKTHGPFNQEPSGHLSGRGCPQCGKESISSSQRQSIESFVSKAKAVHGEKYDYSKVIYETAKRPVTIVCPIHGEIAQTPDRHLQSGCRRCADDDLPGAYSMKVLSRDPALAARLAILYYLLFESASGERFYKVGITLKSIKQRFAGYGATGYTFTVLGEKKLPLIDAFEAEQTLVNAHVKAHHYSPIRGNRERTTKFGGRKECFSVALPEIFANLFDPLA